VFTEIIPKTLGTVHASALAGPCARVTSLLTRLLRPVLAVLRLLTRRMTASHARVRVSRREVAAMAATAEKQGGLDEETSRAVRGILALGDVPVKDVMTPRTVVRMLPSTSTIAQFLDDERVQPFSRIPLHGERQDDLEGHVLQREVLASAARGADPRTPLSAFARESTIVLDHVSVEQMFRRLLEAREHLALVIDEHGAFRGLVTMEDLVETAFGVEILDESDEVADLRVEALRLREERLGRGPALAKPRARPGSRPPA
jgi:CBS domain containing-hemolysin-like protein